jgi:hypothetical protein
VFCQGSKLPSVVNVGRSLSRGQGRTMFPLSKKKCLCFLLPLLAMFGFHFPIKMNFIVF